MRLLLAALGAALALGASAGCGRARSSAPPAPVEQPGSHSEGGAAATGPTPSSQTYRNATFGWSVEVPNGWRVDSQEVAYVKVIPPPGGPDGFVGIQAGDVAFPDVDAIVDAILERQRGSGQGVTVLSRRAITLSDGSPAVALDTELGVGVVGRSHRVFTLTERRTVILDAETYKSAWPVYEAQFLRIAQSLRVRAP